MPCQLNHRVGKNITDSAHLTTTEKNNKNTVSAAVKIVKILFSEYIFTRYFNLKSTFAFLK